jgi:endonuclease-8
VPEGHTIHALAARLEAAFGGGPVRASSPQGRFGSEAAQLDGRVLESATAVGKHLFVDLEDRVLHVHLGLIGTFPVRPYHRQDRAGPPEPTGAVRLRLVGTQHVADLRGPMTCALIDEGRRAVIEEALGPDPLDPKAEPDRALRRIRRSRKGIGALLMEQQVIAGIGNVYRCEVLHRLAIDPFTRGVDLTDGAWWDIWAELTRLLPLGAAFSQILTMDDQVLEAERMVADGSAGEITQTLTGERLGEYFERRFLTYQRAGEACRRCDTVLACESVAGRVLYWCRHCQTRR